MRILNAPITVSPTSAPDGFVGQPYSLQLTASGGTGSGYVFDDPNGTLPPGLSVSSAGLISGTPSQAGNFAVSLRVRDSGSGMTFASL